MPNPKQRYQRLVNDGAIALDPNQQTALAALDALQFELKQPHHRPAAIKGLYLWGNVGRGKTFLMDLFVAGLDPQQVLRQHFHHFMASVHQQLRTYAGRADPLTHIARALAKQFRVLCFDEFMVADIGDAMLLGRLLQALFAQRVTLVATSNTEPGRLYWDGLQRSQFLPAIDAIQAHTTSIHLDGGQDHRERNAERNHAYFVYHDPASALLKQQEILTRLGLSHDTDTPHSISILERDIPCIAHGDGCIGFAFSQLCEGPRSHLDYIEIARRYHTLALFNVPRFSGNAYERIKARGTEDGSVGSGVTGEREVMLAPMDDAARRFIALIDECYERRIRVLITGEAEPGRLYAQGRLGPSFERTRSRLMEMGAAHYPAIGG